MQFHMVSSFAGQMIFTPKNRVVQKDKVDNRKKTYLLLRWLAPSSGHNAIFSSFNLFCMNEQHSTCWGGSNFLPAVSQDAKLCGHFINTPQSVSKARFLFILVLYGVVKGQNPWHGLMAAWDRVISYHFLFGGGSNKHSLLYKKNKNWGLDIHEILIRPCVPIQA